MTVAIPIGQFWFEVLGELGAGGLGQVDKIRITASNNGRKPVGSVWARKRLNAKWRANPNAQTRFEREIKALSKMSHGNIVTCEGENLDGGERFYVMPLFTHSVRRHIADRGFLGNWREVANSGAILADALHYAHGMGFIHRDIKPDNILFNGGGPLTVADWGIGYFVHKASTVLQQLTRGGMGTEYYCSQEQWLTGKCDGRGDIYSLGMTLDEWVRGAQSAIVVGSGVTWQTSAEVSRGAQRFNGVVQRMTKRGRDDRYLTMSQVAAELRAAVAASA